MKKYKITYKAYCTKSQFDEWILGVTKIKKSLATQKYVLQSPYPFKFPKYTGSEECGRRMGKILIYLLKKNPSRGSWWPV